MDRQRPLYNNRPHVKDVVKEKRERKRESERKEKKNSVKTSVRNNYNGQWQLDYASQQENQAIAKMEDNIGTGTF